MASAMVSDVERQEYDDADSTAGEAAGGDGEEGVAIGDPSRAGRPVADVADVADGRKLEDRNSLRKEPFAEKSWNDFMRFLTCATAGSKESNPQPESRPEQPAQSWKESFLDWLKNGKHVTFYRIHFACFFIVMMIMTLILYISPNGEGGPLPFIDAMFSATSALCVTGLISVRMNQLSTFDKVVLLFCMLLGGQVLTSLVPVFVRRYYFKKYLKKEGIFDSAGRMSIMGGGGHEGDRQAAEGLPLQGLPEEDQPQQQQQQQQQPLQQQQEEQVLQPALSAQGQERSAGKDPSVPLDGPLLRKEQEDRSLPRQASHGSLLPRVGSGNSPAAICPVYGADDVSTPARVDTRRVSGAQQQPWGFRSLFDESDDVANRANMTWAGETAQINARRLKQLRDAARLQTPGSATTLPLPQRALSVASPLFLSDTGDEIDFNQLVPGGRRFLELMALEMLSWLVPVYMVGIQLLCFLLLLICLLANEYYLDLLDTNGTNVVFMAAFQSVSAFANAGLSLFDNNLMSFYTYVPYLLIVMCLILLGNTLYAPTLRLLLIVIRRFGTKDQRFVAKYLLEHPRKCYTHLFPASDTRWLLATVLLFNGTEFVFFCALDWTSPALDGFPSGVKVLDGVFQSISTRNAGYNVINISLLSPAMLVLYAAMMYIAVYPVYVTRQRSRVQREVYDSDDLQIFYEDLEKGVWEKGVLAQGKRMFSRDSALLFLAVFLICIIQQQEFETDSANFNTFNVIFEAISAYGNVGLSLGYTCQPDVPDCDPVPYSFSGVWRAGSKFILILVMFLGRHRGLPDNIDHAIMIPDQKRFRQTQPPEENNEARALLRMASSISLPRAQSSALTRRTSGAVGRSAADFH